jgi:Skp family chaperone for outer membrane proteins
MPKEKFNFFYVRKFASLLYQPLVSQLYLCILFSSMQLFTTKRLFIGSCCLGSLMAISGACYSWLDKPTPKIAYVDTDKLLNSYQAMVTARNQYQREKQEWQQNLLTLSKEAEQATNQAQQLAKSATPTEKLTRERDARLKKAQLLNYQQAVSKQEPEEMQRLTQPVIASVNRYIATYSREHQYSLVLTTAGQGDVVYSDSKLDITTDIVKNLNRYLADSLAQTFRAPSSRQLAGQP